MYRFDKVSIHRRLRAITKSVATVLFTRNTVTFLLFLMLSALFWLMYNAGTKRAVSVDFPIKYVGIPETILLKTDLPKTLTVAVKDEGGVLMNYKLTAETDTVNINFSSLFLGESPVTFDFRSLKDNIAQRLPSSSDILSIKPEIVSLDFVTLERALKPVKLAQNVQLAPSHVLIDSVSLSPSEVEVFAPRAVLDTLRFVEAQNPVSEPLTKTLILDCPLRPVESARFSTNSVTMTAQVEMSTEKTLEIPIVGSGLPHDVSLRSFPAVVQVTFSVGVSRFSAVTEKDFSAVVKYADIQKTDSYKVPVLVTTSNKHVKNLRFSPSEVEFLLEK